jgi:hypothetical protein
MEQWTRENFPKEPLKLKPIFDKYKVDGSPIGPMGFSTFRKKMEEFAYMKSHNVWLYKN